MLYRYCINDILNSDKLIKKYLYPSAGHKLFNNLIHEKIMRDEMERVRFKSKNMNENFVYFMLAEIPYAAFKIDMEV